MTTASFVGLTNAVIFGLVCRGFGRTNSGLDGADLSGQSWRGFGRMAGRISTLGCGFGALGPEWFKLAFDGVGEMRHLGVFWVRRFTMESLERRVELRGDATRAPTQAPEWRSRSRNPGQKRNGEKPNATARLWLRTGPPPRRPR